MNFATIIIDMQQDFFTKEKLAANKKNLIKNINSLASLSRQKHIPVIWVKQILKSDLSDSPLGNKDFGEKIVIEGSLGAELLSGLDVRPQDKIVIKKRYSAFFNTNLEDLISKMHIDTLIVAGINTHACVRMTVIDAYQRDLRVIVAEDCVDSWDEEHHKITMRYFVPQIARVLNNKEIFSLLEK